MIPEPLLAQAILFEVGLFVAVWVLVIGNGIVASIRGRRRPALQKARRVLAAALPERTLNEEARQALRKLDASEATVLFATFTPHLRGAEQDWLAGIALELGLVARARRLCRSRLWWRRLHGARLLTLVGGDEEAVLNLRDDPNPLVRSQFAEWAGVHPTPAGIRALTDMLGDPSRASRYSVQDALVRLGGLAVEPLAARLTDGLDDALAAVTGLRVAAGLGDPRLLRPVLSLADSPEPAVRRAALEALGAIGGGPAAERLTAALHEPDAATRSVAAAALGRMRHWQAASALGQQLSHTAWDVRLSAGRALTKLGAPGEVVLRNTLASSNAFAADMARHVLDRARLDRTRTAGAG